MLLWYTKENPQGVYVQRLTPSKYKIDWEDLDNKSYRSVATGNLIDNVVSKKWSKLQFDYNHLTGDEVNELLTIINDNPILVKAVNPFFTGGYIEAEFRCSKASCEMLEDQNYKLSFNLVQKKKVNGQ